MQARTFAAVAGLLTVVLTAATGRAEECIFGQAAPPGAPPGTGACCPIPSTEQILAQGEWEKCLNHAVDTFFDQPEAAQTIVTASYATCRNVERTFRNIATAGLYRGGWCAESWVEVAKHRVTPTLIARVMADRAALARSQKVTPKKNSPRPAIDYNKM
jgi:hypothetical protein